jgi:hypothetical protein
MLTLEEIIISRGEIEKIYRANIALTLWRGLHSSDDKINPLYPDFYRRDLPNGDIREPDVTIVRDQKTGKEIVKSEEGVGTSLTDKEGLFGHKSWEYYVIPKGTVIPKELIITKDHYLARKKCWHYSISPNVDMAKEDFIAALDKLAQNAGIKVKGKTHATG